MKALIAFVLLLVNIFVRVWIDTDSFLGGAISLVILISSFLLYSYASSEWDKYKGNK